MHIKSVSYKEKERILTDALFKARPLAALTNFSGSAPAPFVGKFGYPHVNVGILAPPHIDEQAWQYDAPRHWAANNFGIKDVVAYRTSMVNSTFTSSVKQPSKYVELAQDVAMSHRAVDVDVALEKKPHLALKTNQHTAPMGPTAKTKNIELASNPHIHTRVQRYFDDTDVLARDALIDLYQHETDENALSRMLSVGIFGKEKKLVPTRWSITATDDTLANHFLAHVRDLPIGDYAAYFGNYLGNHYLLLFLPQRWSYELFEMYVAPGVLEYSTDHEEFLGRKTYAEQCAGGYYTVRLALCEHMKKEKRQNTVIALRFITNEYVLPLGVWVTREAARKALSNKPISFSSKELLLTYAKQLAKRKFGLDIEPILQKSKLIKEKQKDILHWTT